MAKDYNFKNIRDLLTEGFFAEELSRFCFDTPVFRPVHNQLSSGIDKAGIIDRILEFAEQRRVMDILLDWAREKNPAQYEEYHPYENGREGGEELPPHLDHVRANFQAAYEQIRVMGNYKDLHDQLHMLQFHCYDSILREASRFPDDEEAVDHLIDHKLTLQQIIDSIKDSADHMSFATSETLWIQELDKAREELDEAINDSNRQPLDKVIWRLKRVLNVQPARINIRLTEAARAVHLPTLVETMKSMGNDAIRLHFDEEKIRRFETAVDDVIGLNLRLTSLIHDHDEWQAIDVELRRIEDNLKQDMMELEMSWPDLKARTAPLYSDSTDEWAISLKTDGEKLDSAIATKNPVMVKRHFRYYRRQVSLRFYQVDLDLKRLCEGLRENHGPLALIGGII